MQTRRAQVIVFAKQPRSGEVKTRLAASLGVDMALQVYRELLTDVVSKLGPAEAWDFSLAVTPDESVDDEESRGVSEFEGSALARAAGGTRTFKA